MSEDVAPEYVKKRVLILGVGNVLFGDDGFGPAAADYILENHRIPDDMGVMNMGTSVGDVLFTILLSKTKPNKIIILDAVDMHKKPGEIFELSVDDLPESKLTDFSMHFFPSTNLLKTLQENMNIHIKIIACQVTRTPKKLHLGLSNSVKQALPKAALTALKLARKRASSK